MVNFAVFLQKYLCAGLMVAKANLVELDLSDNAFGPNGMNGLTDFLRSSSCYSLRELRLNNNGLGIHGGKVGHHFCLSQFCLCLLTTCLWCVSYIALLGRRS